MKIDSPRFGTLDVEAAQAIEFPLGFAGFENLHRFTLFHCEGADPKYFVLQSLDDADIAFHIVDPARFGFAYEIELSDAEAAMLDLSAPDDAVVAVMVLRDADEAPLRANLDAPLVINAAVRRGLQHVFAKLDYTLTLKG